MPRAPKPKMGTGANRLDNLVPAPNASVPGQPNGRPVRALIPNGLPYGEHGALQQDLNNTPTAPGLPRPPVRSRPMPAPPTGMDMTQGVGLDAAMQAINGWTPPPAPALTAPTDRPNEHPMTGAINRPDSIVPSAPTPGGPGAMIGQVASMTGSGALQGLATQLQANGQ